MTMLSPDEIKAIQERAARLRGGSSAQTPPDGFIDYDEAGNPFMWQGGVRVPAPPGTPARRGSTVAPIINNSVTLPASATAAYTGAEIEAAVAAARAQGLNAYKIGTVWHIVDPKSGQGVRYVADTVRGETRFNEQPFNAPAGTQVKPTVADAVGGALRGLGIGGSEPNQPIPEPVQPAPAQPLGQGNAEAQEFYRLPTPGEQLRGIERGPLDMVRLPTGPGGSRDINRDTVNMGLAASGVSPTGDFEKDFRTWGNEQGKRAVLQAMNPDMDPARIQSAFFQPAMQERTAMRNQRVADLLSTLDLRNDPLENVGYTDEEMAERLRDLQEGGIPGFASGGQVMTGWEAGAKSRERELFRDNRDRQARSIFGGLTDRGYQPLNQPYTGTLYRQPGTGAMVPPWLLPAFNFRGGGYGPGQETAMRRWSGDGFIGPVDAPEREEYESYTGSGVNSFPNAGVTPQVRGATRNVGYAPRFADGGTQMLQEPVVGVGLPALQRGQIDPKFVAGEDGDEMVTFTPMSQPRMDAPYPRAKRPVQLLDPRRVLASMKRK